MDEQKPPRVLWKYRNFDRHVESGITKGRLKFSYPSELNDPFEFRWRHKFPTGAKAIDDFLRELLAAEFPGDSMDERKLRYLSVRREVADYTRRHKGRPFPIDFAARSGVLCLTEEYDNLLMWSHYAEQHRGVCFGIDTTLLGKRISRQVNYTDIVPVIDVRDYLNDASDSFLAMSLSKCPNWGYEKEWRTIHRQGLHDFPGCVRHVIVGAMASHETLLKVRGYASKCGHTVKVHRARLSNDKFAVEIQPPVPQW